MKKETPQKMKNLGITIHDTGEMVGDSLGYEVRDSKTNDWIWVIAKFDCYNHAVLFVESLIDTE